MLAFVGLAAQHAVRSRLLGDVDIAQDFLVLILGRYRADMRVGTSRVAHPRRARKGEQFVQEGFIDALLHKQARAGYAGLPGRGENRSEEHTSELQSLMRLSYAVFCLKNKNNNKSYYITQTMTTHRTT